MLKFPRIFLMEKHTEMTGGFFEEVLDEFLIDDISRED